MHKITLLCSAHTENGLCNACELLKILRDIEPDVIFVEMRPGEFDSHLKQGNVEATAIAKYCEFRAFQTVPVDRYEMRQQFLVEMKNFEAWMMLTSQEYQELMERQGNSVEQKGFRYLNSAEFATESARMSEIEDEAVTRTGDEYLVNWLARLRHLMLGREAEMVRGIYGYCRDNVFDVGVFLLGAAHKTAIIKKMESYATAKVDLISWNPNCEV